MSKTKSILMSVICSLLVGGLVFAVSDTQKDSTDSKTGKIVFARGQINNGSSWVDDDGTPTPQVFDDDGASNCVDITTSSAQKTLPTASNLFQVCASGNTAWILCGANPTASSTVGTGFSLILGDGQCTDIITIESAKCAVKGPSAAGSVCFRNFT